MVFIWNGINYKVVDAKEFEENAENYCGYVIARRLFVSSLKPNQTNVRNYYYKNIRPKKNYFHFFASFYLEIFVRTLQ